MHVKIDKRIRSQNVGWFQKNLGRCQKFKVNTSIDRLLCAHWSVSKFFRALNLTKETPAKMLVGFKKMLVGFKKLGKYDCKSIFIFGKS